MIVDDSFYYHSLSLTIMFAIKRSMIVHDSLSKSRNVLAYVPSDDLFRFRSNSFPDIKFQGIIISSYIAIVVVIAKDVPQTWPGIVLIYQVAYLVKIPLQFSLPGFLDFFAFLTFSLSASLSSEYQSKLLLCCSSQDNGNAVAICIEPALVVDSE